jgi:outer membrane protein
LSAYRTNPRLDAERARLRATDEEVARATAGFRPTIAGTADVTYDRSRTRPPAVGDGEDTPHGYALSVTQPIFSGFRTINQVKEAEATVRSSRETLRSVEQAVLLEAATAYMDVVRDNAILKLRENNVTVLSRELKATQDRFSVGEVTRTDVAQAEARRAGAVSALDLAKANLRTSMANYERSIGHPAGPVSDPGAPSLKAMPSSSQSAVSISMKESPTIVAALYREEAARNTVERIWGELLPEVRLDATYARRYDTSSTVDLDETTTVTGRVNVPIYAGGEVHARVRQAKHTHVSRLQEIEQAKTETQALVIGAWSRLSAARAQLISDQTKVSANRTALAGVREEQRVGQRTLIEVLNAEQELLDAEVSLVTTRRELVVAAYNLLATVGRLGVTDISLTDTVYDPEAHYFEVRRKWWGISITYGDGHRESMDLWNSHGQHRPMK